MSHHPADPPPPGLPPAGWAPASEATNEAEHRVAWRARDLFFTLAGGLALSILLIFPVLIVAFGDAEVAPSMSAIGGVGILVYIGLAIAGWFFALKRRGVGWREGGFRRVSGATLLKMIPVTLGLMFLNAIVVGLSAQVFGDVPTAQDQILGDATSITFDEFIWLFALGAIAAPIVEEFLFRGLLYPLLRGRMKVVVAVAVSALLFALLHFIPPLIPALLMMGIVLAILVERYNSIVPAIVVHALNNGAALIGLYLAIGR